MYSRFPRLRGCRGKSGRLISSRTPASCGTSRRGGISRFIYGGNAFLYHLTLAEYEQLLEWLSTIRQDGLWFIPSAGPSYGRLMDQAPLLRRHAVPCVMALPCGDPRDAAGLEQGLREFADAAGARLMLYLKEETNMGANLAAGLDVVAKLVDEGICIAIKYAVVRAQPENDQYLDELLQAPSIGAK